LAAVAVGRYFKIPAERISRAIAAYEPSNNRSQLTQTAQNELIVDAYNANPASMKAAIANFKDMEASPKAVILGDMKELGAESNTLHREIVKEVKSGKFDKVFFCGESFARVAKSLPTYPTLDALIAELKSHPLQGYHILLKGSHSMALEKVIEFL
jgi:UDP-N-acetylmuramoyl-tripeptide--D-alanyl-D-alanine ligase